MNIEILEQCENKEYILRVKHIKIDGPFHGDKRTYIDSEFVEFGCSMCCDQPWIKEGWADYFKIHKYEIVEIVNFFLSIVSYSYDKDENYIYYNTFKNLNEHWRLMEHFGIIERKIIDNDK